jgi:hypothetical protein
MYEQAGFKVTRIQADNKFKSMADTLKMTHLSNSTLEVPKRMYQMPQEIFQL